MKRRLLLTLLLTMAAGPLRADAPAAPATPAPEASAYEKSLWEAGLIGGGGYLPDYPAAGQNHAKWIIAPYFVYRGRIMRADRDGARARLARGAYYEIDFSLAASFASRSKDNDARQGMPDLDYMLEFGPRLSFTLSRLGGRGKLRLLAPVRAVFSTDLGDFHHRGWTSTPALNARWRLGKGSDALGVVQLTSNFADRQVSAYFYDVKPAYARPGRPFYDARAGYLGTDLFGGVLLPVAKRLRLFTGVQVLLHSLAANESSPLFRNKVNYSLAAGLVWTFYRSPRPSVPGD